LRISCSIVRVAAAVLLAGLASFSTPSRIEACSICRCGDATFNALGKDGFAVRGLRLALDWERFDKDEGNPAEESESQVENRFTALVSYGFNDRFTVFARVPYSVRDLTTRAAGAEPESTHTSGLSDPEVYGQMRLWASPLAALGRRASLSLNAGIKTPWGGNDVRQDGERVDEHAQPGTGSTDLFGSLAFLYLIDRKSALFVSTSYRHTGENDFAYRYGSSFLANVAYEHKLGRVFDGVVELNFRHAGKDRIDEAGTLDDDTGGSLLYLTPRLLANLGHGLVLRAAAQVPVARGLNGFQEERVVANVGLTYLLSFSH
jgi:outer membrane putative beta-barrel porin/alpha-amylase